MMNLSKKFYQNYIKTKEQQFSQKELEFEQLIKGIKSNIVNILEKKFNNISLDLVTEINKINDSNKLQYLLFEAVSIATIEDFSSVIQQEII